MMNDVSDGDGVSSEESSTQTCCKHRFDRSSSIVNSNSKANVLNAADCAASTATANGAKSFELLGKSERQSNIPDRDDSPEADVRLQECDSQTVMSWQRSRSLIMGLLGVVVRICFSSVILSGFIQVPYLLK